MTVEKACGYIREALEEMGEKVMYDRDIGFWMSTGETNRISAVSALLLALDSLDPMGTTYKEEG